MAFGVVLLLAGEWGSSGLEEALRWGLCPVGQAGGCSFSSQEELKEGEKPHIQSGLEGGMAWNLGRGGSWAKLREVGSWVTLGWRVICSPPSPRPPSLLCGPWSGCCEWGESAPAPLGGEAARKRKTLDSTSLVLHVPRVLISGRLSHCCQENSPEVDNGIRTTFVCHLKNQLGVSWKSDFTPKSRFPASLEKWEGLAALGTRAWEWLPHFIPWCSCHHPQLHSLMSPARLLRHLGLSPLVSCYLSAHRGHFQEQNHPLWGRHRTWGSPARGRRRVPAS